MENLTLVKNGNMHPGNNSDGTKHDNCYHGKFGATKALSTEDCGCYTAAITTTSSYVYNANWEILSCEQKRKGCSNIKYCYKYDDAGNRIEASKWTGNTKTDIVKYTYNDSNQIETFTTLEKKKWVTTTYEYDADGNLTLGYSDNVNSNSLVHRTGNMYTYNGEDYNRETGLQYLRARWYDTNHAVFLSEDSYLGDLLQPLTRNRYLYAIIR